MKDDILTKEEQGWLGIMRLNQSWPKQEIRRSWQIGRLSVGFVWKSRKNLMGRFGGGWNWRIGIQAGSWRSVIVSLLICSVRINIRKKA
jgi:hypothetical protein